MNYRNFNKLGFNVSLFGVGCMRLPLSETSNEKNDGSNIDIPRSVNLIRHAIDNGVTYFDTAYVYHGGKSEVLLGKALQDGYREKVRVASKMPVWEVKKYEDFDRILSEQLDRLQTDHIDFYLLHAFDKARWENMKKLDVFKFLEEAKKLGKIKSIGFSFHDNLAVFKEIIDFYNWDMCQIQLNLLDDNYQAGLKGLKYAKEKNIPVVIMEPLKGGTLARNIPDEVLKIYNSYEKKYSPVEWAFKWIANFDNVITILSGVSNEEQLADNLEIFSKDDTDANALSESDLKMIDEVRDTYKEKIKVGCTACAYCMPCPAGVNIPDIFSFYNSASIFGKETQKGNFENLERLGKGSSSCVECGNCEGECPQHLQIIEKLKEAKEFFAN